MRKKTYMFEYLDHPADIQMHCYAKSLEELYEAAIMGTMNYAVEINKTTSDSGKVLFTNETNEIALVNIITYFLDLMYGENKVVFNIKINIEGKNLICDYMITDDSECEIKCEIKAVTFCGLKIYKLDDTWHSYCIFDV